MPKAPSKSGASTRTARLSSGNWTMRDAQSGRFAEIARQAEAEGPQRIRLGAGRALIVTAERKPTRGRRPKTSLRSVMLKAADTALEFERLPMPGPVRDIEL